MAAAPPTANIYTSAHEGVTYLFVPDNHPAYETTRVFLLWDLTFQDGRAAIPYQLAILTFLPTYNLSKTAEDFAALAPLSTCAT